MYTGCSNKILSNLGFRCVMDAPVRLGAPLDLDAYCMPQQVLEHRWTKMRNGCSDKPGAPSGVDSYWILHEGLEHPWI